MKKLSKVLAVIACIVTIGMMTSCSKDDTPSSLVNTRWETGDHGHMGFALQFLNETDVAIIDCHYEYGDDYQENVEFYTHYRYEAPNGIIFKDSDNIEYWSFIVNGNTLTWYVEDVMGSPLALTRQ